MKKAIFVLFLSFFLVGCSTRREATLPEASSPVIPPAASAQPTAAPSPTPGLPAETSAPASEPSAVPVPASAPPVQSGAYRFESAEYGVWEIHIKNNGTFSVISPERIYNGEGWSDNGDGTVSLGGTEAAGAAPFFDEFGSSVWRIDGERCEPCM